MAFSCGSYTFTDPDLALIRAYQRVFVLRNATGPDAEIQSAVKELIEIFYAHSSNLLRHEVCFVLGQMQASSAYSFLKERLMDKSEYSMTRHEAGEAIGALGGSHQTSNDLDTWISVVESCKNDSCREVAETCQLSHTRLLQCKAEVCESDEKKYKSVDPVLVAEKPDLAQCMATFSDISLPLEERYKALFALRDAGGEEAIHVLCHALLCDSSALLKHEIAYVLGQMQDEKASPALSKVSINTL